MWYLTKIDMISYQNWYDILPTFGHTFVNDKHISKLDEG